MAESAGERMSLTPSRMDFPFVAPDAAGCSEALANLSGHVSRRLVQIQQFTYVLYPDVLAIM